MDDMINEKLAVKKKIKADEAKKASETVVKSVVNDCPFISFVKSTQSKIETGTEYVKSFFLNKEK